jgi:hypothetical protein
MFVAAGAGDGAAFVSSETGRLGIEASLAAVGCVVAAACGPAGGALCAIGAAPACGCAEAINTGDTESGFSVCAAPVE